MCPEGTVADIGAVYITLLCIVPVCIRPYVGLLFKTLISATVPSGHMVRVPNHLAPQAPSKANLLLE